MKQCNIARPADFRELLLPLRLEEKQEELLKSINKGWVGGPFYKVIGSLSIKKQSTSIDLEA